MFFRLIFRTLESLAQLCFLALAGVYLRRQPRGRKTRGVLGQFDFCASLPLDRLTPTSRPLAGDAG